MTDLSTAPLVDCWIGLGSNLGDRIGSLQSAVRYLARIGNVEILKTSSIYESDPWGFVDQPIFLNAVLHARTALGPVQLLVCLQAIEAEIGRTRTFRWGPREIDLDILRYGDEPINRRGLISPHPAMEERAFVLVPLREVSPDFRTLSGQTIDALIAALGPDQAGVRLAKGAPSLLVR